MPVTMEPTLRKLGLPVRLIDGKIMLPGDCQVCKAGDALSPEQCKILVHFAIFQHISMYWRHGCCPSVCSREWDLLNLSQELLGLQIASFRIVLHCVYRAREGTFTLLTDGDDAAMSADSLTEVKHFDAPNGHSKANGATPKPVSAAASKAAALAAMQDDEEDEDDDEMAMDLDDVEILGGDDDQNGADDMEVDTPRRSTRATRSSSRPKAGARSKGSDVPVPQVAQAQRGKGRNTRGAVRRGR